MKLLHGTTDCIHIDALSLIAASSCLNLGKELSSSMFMGSISITCVHLYKKLSSARVLIDSQL